MVESLGKSGRILAEWTSPGTLRIKLCRDGERRETVMQISVKAVVDSFIL